MSGESSIASTVFGLLPKAAVLIGEPSAVPSDVGGVTSIEPQNCSGCGRSVPKAGNFALPRRCPDTPVGGVLEGENTALPGVRQSHCFHKSRCIGDASSTGNAAEFRSGIQTAREWSKSYRAGSARSLSVNRSCATTLKSTESPSGDRRGTTSTTGPNSVASPVAVLTLTHLICA